jgi:hypothetical protein
MDVYVTEGAETLGKTRSVCNILGEKFEKTL